MGLRQRASEAMRSLPPGVHEAVPPAIRRNLRHTFGRYYMWERGFDFHERPALGPGEESGPPGFVGIGVQKAGTTWWCALIEAHPGVSSRPMIHKERHFFGRFGAESFGTGDIEDYHQWFPRRPGTMAGEWTPDYFYEPWVPPLLARAAPDAKLLLLLRDPVQRFRSGIAHTYRNGADHVGRTQSEALGRSLYAGALELWRDSFPEDQLLVLQYEACVDDPAGELARTYEYLGLDPTFVPLRLREEVNKTQEPKVELPSDVVNRLEDLVRPDLARLSQLLPGLDLDRWPSAAGLWSPGR